MRDLGTHGWWGPTLSSLPSSGNYEGRQCIVGGTYYRYVSGSWVAQPSSGGGGGSGGGAIVSGTAWTNIPMGAWNVEAYPGFQTPQYRRDETGRVHLRGLIRTPSAFGQDTKVIFTLPSGFRPASTLLFDIMQDNHDARLDLNTSGDCSVFAPFTTNGYLALDGVNFHADGYGLQPLPTSVSPWQNFALTSGWAAYDSTIFNTPGFYKDVTGRVYLRGLIKDGAVGTVASLPSDCRPSRAEVLDANAADVGSANLRIETSGLVRLQGYKNGGTNGYVSLDGLSFMAADGPYGIGDVSAKSIIASGTGWTVPTFLNGWTSYPDPTYGQVRYRRTAEGRVQMRGLIASGPVGQGSPAFQLPAGFRPTAGTVAIFDVRSNNGQAEVRVSADGTLWINSYSTGGSNAWVVLDQIEFDADGFAPQTLPVSVFPWTPLAIPSGWSGSAAFMQDGTGRIHLRGFLTATAAKAGGATIVQLPVGKRPPTQVFTSALYSIGPTRLDVQNDGIVTCGPNLASGGWVSLDGVNFMVADGPFAIGLPVLPQVRVRKTAVQQVSSGVVTNLTWNASVYDLGTTDPQWNGATGFVCKVPGLYRIGATASMGGAGGARRLLAITQAFAAGGSTEVDRVEQTPGATAAMTPTLSVNSEARLAVGDTILAAVFQDSGANLGVDTLSSMRMSFASA